MLFKCKVETGSGDRMYDITRIVRDKVISSGIKSGICVVYVPHTTCGVTINENADPDVQHDIIKTLDRLIPYNDPAFLHMEGNSAAHIKSSMFGFSQTVIINDGDLVLGIWQGIYLCEFERVKTARNVYIKIIEG